MKQGNGFRLKYLDESDGELIARCVTICVGCTQLSIHVCLCVWKPEAALFIILQESSCLLR